MFQSLFTCVLFVEMLERRFPSQFSSFMTECMYQSIYFYSKLQLWFTKLQVTITRWMEQSPIVLSCLKQFSEHQPITQTIQYVNNGVFTEDKSKIDFAVVSWYDNKKGTNIVNKCVLYKDVDDMSSVSKEVSNVGFILVEVHFGEKHIFKLNLKTEQYNYYMVHNMFGQLFLLFFLKHHLGTDLSGINVVDMRLKIIDHNVNVTTIDFKKYPSAYIELRKTDYAVVNVY